MTTLAQKKGFLPGRSPSRLLEVTRAVSHRFLQFGGYAFGGIAALLVLIWLFIRVFGLPTFVQDRLNAELGKRNLQVGYSRLYLDPFGAVIVGKVVVKNPALPESALVTIDRVRLRVAWLSWWRATSLVEEMDLKNARVAIPLGSGTVGRIGPIQLRVRTMQDQYEIQRCRFNLQGIQFSVAGRIPVTLLKPKNTGEPRPLDLEKLGMTWRKVEAALAQTQMANPVQITLNLEGEAETMSGSLEILSGPLDYKGLIIERIALVASSKGGEAELRALAVDFEQGSLRGSGRADWKKKSAFLSLHSTMAPRCIAPLLPPAVADAVRTLEFRSSPQIQAAFKADWNEGFKPSVQADLLWRDFSCGKEAIKELTIPVAWEPDRLFIPDGVLKIGEETLSFKLMQQQEEPALRGEILGVFNPKKFQAALPKSAQPFFNSCQFSSGIKMDATLSGQSFQAGEWKVAGRIDLEDARYKGVEIRRLATSIEADGRSLIFKDVLMTKPEGKGTATLMHYDLKERMLTLRGVRSQLHVQQTAHLFGGNFEKYCEPYLFKNPPTIDVEGVTDLGGGMGTNIRMELAGGPMTYPFLGVLLPPTRAKASLSFKGRGMSIRSLTADLHEGRLLMAGEFDFTRPEAKMDATFDVQEMAFGKVMMNLFKTDGVSGILNGKVRIKGTVGRLETLQGDGEMNIRDGFLTNIPFLGGLSALLNSIIPDLGYAKAKDASCTFLIGEGKVKTSNLDLRSLAFTIIGNGDYSFLKDEMNMDARVNMRGPVGLMLFPVSKLFEYHGTGSLREPKWAPKFLSE